MINKDHLDVKIVSERLLIKIPSTVKEGESVFYSELLIEYDPGPVYIRNIPPKQDAPHAIQGGEIFHHLVCFNMSIRQGK